MRTFHKLKNHFHCPIINLDKLWTLVGEEVRPAENCTPAFAGGLLCWLRPAACANWHRR